MAGISQSSYPRGQVSAAVIKMSVPAEGLLQVLRYAVVGVLTNAMLFSSYLLLSAFGIGAKAAMTLLYVPGVMIGFLGNRNFTFRHRGRIPASMVRYFATYGFGYAFNFASLVVFVDVLQLPPDYVVLALIVVTAGMLFALQKWWVFPQRQRSTAPSEELSAG
jgi:putative flippase GtrA